MRDKRFVAEHRGGPLHKDQHRRLMAWAIDCSKHVLALYGAPVDDRLKNALSVAKDWEQGRATVGEARKASVEAIRAAQQSTNPTAIAVARSVGQAVAAAHMADHSLQAAWYCLKAVKSSGGNVEGEMKWQNEQLPHEIKELVLSARRKRNI